ncbi:MAG: Lrp/AsnC family transcriptional regulator for asnA, asnC and gidA [Sphingobacteriales bacterium]|jgi:Lrp/AsnC family transcriptional regulator for asnA, asnC and gidA
MKKEGENYELDNTDLGILNILMKDAKTPYTIIGEKLFVSAGTVHVRMKKMEKLGIIKTSTLNIDYSKIGYDVTAFIGIYLNSSQYYDSVVEQLKEIPEVTDIHYTTGAYSMFGKIVCRDTRHLRTVLHDKLQKVEGIQRTDTLISLEESINRSIDLVS